MITVENRVGRLMEVTFVAPIEAIDLPQVLYGLSALIAKLRVILVVIDARQVLRVSPDEEQSYLRLMRSDNPLLVRRAILHSGSAQMREQINRMTGTLPDGGEKTQVFSSPSVLTTWMDAILTPEERVRLRQFLKGADVKPK